MKQLRGFTLIEFMIAMTLSLLVLAALTGAFVSSSKSRAEIEKNNEQIENGRFALQILTDDVEMAGFLSHLDIDLALGADTALPVPAAKPDPCMEAGDAAMIAALVTALPLHIQGYDSPAALPAELDCLADVKPNTDIILVRRTATCVSGAANCPTVAGAPLLQASLCADELDSLDYKEYFDLDTVDANLTRRPRSCVAGADAEKRQYLVHIYFIANNDVAGDGVPTLKRAELGNDQDPTGFTIVPLARGIEDLQIDYGVDHTGNGGVRDGLPDTFTADPDSFDANGNGAVNNAELVQNWRDVMSLRLNLLARNTSTTKDHVDTKVYVLGANADGSDRCAKTVGAVCGAFNDGYKRHVYQTSVRLNNPAGRRES